MSDASVEGSDSVATGSFSRRNALKVGAAAGVGIAAWSGASITSLGGTPAYAAAAGCTGVIKLDLSGGCRNTDQSSGCSPAGEFRYHTLNTVAAPFSLANNPAEGTCCQTVAANQPVLSWSTPNLTCKTHVELWDGGNSKCVNRTGVLLVNAVKEGVGGPSGGNVTIDMSCFQFTNGNKTPGGDTFWQIYANCASNGAPEGCL
jgi:hypothetical protein